jgi:transketolase
MRNAFIRALTEEALRDERIVFLTADLGFKLFDDFAKKCPGRFFNVGVAEATMAGVAAGLALEGKKPFIYSIVPFATLRCYEQIRNDIAYHDANVVVVGVGGGYSYGQNGATHHALEDVGALRLLPGLTVVCPGDPAETEAAVRALARQQGPAYLRLGRAGEPAVHAEKPALQLGRALRLREGRDVALLCTGNQLHTGTKVAALLEQRGLSCRLVSMHTVKPLDTAEVEKAARETRLVATLEEHSRLGGLGGAVAEVMAELGLPVRLRRFGAEDRFAHECGTQEFYRRQSGLLPEQVAEALAQLAGAAA